MDAPVSENPTTVLSPILTLFSTIEKGPIVMFLPKLAFLSTIAVG